MLVVRRCEGMLGNFLGETTATYEDVAPYIDRLRAITATLIVHGAVRHVDHCDVRHVLSHFRFSVTRGARKRLVHHPVWGTWKGTPLRNFVEIDPELAGPTLHSIDLDQPLEALVVDLSHALDDHIEGRSQLSPANADELVSFFERSAGVLDLLQQATQKLHAERIAARLQSAISHSLSPTRDQTQTREPDGTTVRDFSALCQTILNELDAATDHARSAITRHVTSDDALAYGRGSDITDARSPGRTLDATRARVRAAHAAFIDEPFMLRVDATTSLAQDNSTTQRRHYAVSRHPVAGIFVEGVSLVSAHSRIGLHLRSTEPDGEFREIAGIANSLAIHRRVEVTPKGPSTAKRDAAVVLDASLQTRSARDWLERVAASTSDETGPPAATRRPASERRKSFQLFDQGSLYKAQRQVLEAPFDQPLALIGPPGTGKTTAVVKRIVDVLSLATEDDEGLVERRVELGLDRALASGCPIGTWVMLVPHADWVRYTRRAFHAEGRVQIEPQLVRTWDHLRAELHRRVFGDVLEGRDTVLTLDDELLQHLVSRLDSTLADAFADVLSSLNVVSPLLDLELPRPPASDAAVPTVYAALAHLLPLLQRRDAGRRARSLISELTSRLASAPRDRRALAGPVRTLAVALVRDAPLDDALDAVRERLYQAGATYAELEAAGAWSILSNAVMVLQRAQRQWLEVDSLLRHHTSELALSEPALRDLAFFFALRNARIAHLGSQDLALRRRDLPKITHTVLGLMFGHIYVDEFENRSTLELATLACLAHPSTDAVAFSGDPQQATETVGASANLRLRLALTLAAMPAPHEIPFERRVRQCSRLAAASDLLRGAPSTVAAVDPTDPDLVLVPSLHPRDWPTWTADRLVEILSACDAAVTTAVITHSMGSRTQLAESLKSRELPFGVKVLELDEDRRPTSAQPAIYLASLDTPHLLHGLEFEGVILLGADDMLELPLGHNRLYVAMTRAARFLGIACAGPWPSALAPLLSVSVGTPWST